MYHILLRCIYHWLSQHWQDTSTSAACDATKVHGLMGKKPSVEILYCPAWKEGNKSLSHVRRAEIAQTQRLELESFTTPLASKPSAQELTPLQTYSWLLIMFARKLLHLTIIASAASKSNLLSWWRSAHVQGWNLVGLVCWKLQHAATMNDAPLKSIWHLRMFLTPNSISFVRPASTWSSHSFYHGALG